MKLATRTVGSGSRTAALVHGASMSGDAWRDFIPFLLEFDLTLIVVDLRGHGDSPRADSYRIQDFADDLVDTLPRGLDFLIGQSLGGLAGAWASAELMPKRFIGIDPAFGIGRVRLFLLGVLGPIQTKLPDRVLRRFGMPPKGSPPDMMARIHAMWAKVGHDLRARREVVGACAPVPRSPADRALDDHPRRSQWRDATEIRRRSSRSGVGRQGVPGRGPRSAPGRPARVGGGASRRLGA